MNKWAGSYPLTSRFCPGLSPSAKLFCRGYNYSSLCAGLPSPHADKTKRCVRTLHMAPFVELPEVERLSPLVIRILGGNPGKVRSTTQCID